MGSIGLSIVADEHSAVDCLKLTKAIQKTSDAIQNVADLYDDHES